MAPGTSQKFTEFKHRGEPVKWIARGRSSVGRAPALQADIARRCAVGMFSQVVGNHNRIVICSRTGLDPGVSRTIDLRFFSFDQTHIALSLAPFSLISTHHLDSVSAICQGASLWGGVGLSLRAPTSDAMPLQTASPDGSRLLIALGKNFDVNGTSTTTTLFILDLDQAILELVAEFAVHIPPLATWSADGQWIAILDSRDIRLVDASDPERTILLEASLVRLLHPEGHSSL